jgi:hypothetical protein
MRSPAARIAAMAVAVAVGELLGEVSELAVLPLRRADEEIEGGVGAEVRQGDEHALGPLDRGSRLHRFGEALTHRAPGPRGR